MARRLQAMGAAGSARGFDLTPRTERLGQPLERKKPTVSSVGSIAGRFHAAVLDDCIERVLAVARQTPRHTDLLLTQRAERLTVLFRVPSRSAQHLAQRDRGEPPHGLPRIGRFRPIPARVRCFKPWDAAVRAGRARMEPWPKDTLGDIIRHR